MIESVWGRSHEAKIGYNLRWKNEGYVIGVSLEWQCSAFVRTLQPKPQKKNLQWPDILGGVSLEIGLYVCKSRDVVSQRDRFLQRFVWKKNGICWLL